MIEQNWHQIHKDLMGRAEEGKSAPEMLFILFAEFERLEGRARSEAIDALALEILSDDAGLAFDAQAIACGYAISELIPVIERRERKLTSRQGPSARAELLTTRSFLESLRNAVTGQVSPRDQRAD